MIKKMKMYHKPVLLEESIIGLKINPNGIYIDATFGGGGHSKLILSKLRNGKLFAFDQDLSSIDNELNSPKFKLINANFRFIKNFLKMEGVEKIDGILADLGISSHQIDVPSRGFSTRFSGDLDMRMNVNSYLTAKDVVNNYSEENLSKRQFHHVLYIIVLHVHFLEHQHHKFQLLDHNLHPDKHPLYD